MINTTCPNCKAPFARKVSLVYEEGYQTSLTRVQENSKSQTILKTKIKTDGVHTETRQTTLSSRLSPPVLINPVLQSSTEAYANILSFIAFLVIVFIAFNMSSSFMGWLLTLIIGTIFSVVFIRHAVVRPPTQQEINEHEKRLDNNKEVFDKWDKSYICMACGNQFIPDEISCSDDLFQKTSLDHASKPSKNSN